MAEPAIPVDGGGPTTPSGEPGLLLHLRRIGFAIPIDFGGRIDLSGDSDGRSTLEERLGPSAVFYPPREGAATAPDPRLAANLVAFLHSLSVNYRYDPAGGPIVHAAPPHPGNCRDVWAALPELSLRWDKPGLSGQALPVLRICENGLSMVHLLAWFPEGSAMSTDSLIVLSGEIPLVELTGQKPVPVPEFFAELLAPICAMCDAHHSPRGRRHVHRASVEAPKRRKDYQFLYLEPDAASPRMEYAPEQLYGILDQDLTYHNVSKETVDRIVLDNLGMIKTADNFVARERRVVVYHGPPEGAIDGVTGFTPAQLVRDWSEYLSKHDLDPRAIDRAAVDRLAPYVDYIMTMEPLLLELALLQRYHDRIDRTLHNPDVEGREEIAILKETLTEELDQYYSIGVTAFSGVSRAMAIAKDRLGITRDLERLNQRLSLIEDAILIDHNRTQEDLQRFLSIIFASFSFASVLEAILLHYAPGWSLEENILFLLLATGMVATIVYFAANAWVKDARSSFSIRNWFSRFRRRIVRPGGRPSSSNPSLASQERMGPSSGAERGATPR